MKVLVLTPWYPTADDSVTGVFVREHAKAAQLYDDVTVVHLVGVDPVRRSLWRLEEETSPELTAGLRTYRLYYGRPAPFTGLVLQWWGCWSAIRWLSKAGFRPDMLHAHIYSAGLAAVVAGRLLGIPVVLTEHSTAFHRRLLGRSEIIKAKLAMQSAARVLPVSYSLQKAIEGYGIRAKFQAVPNVVDTTLFHPALTPLAFNAAKRLLFVGLLDASHKKGMPYLLHALAKVRLRRQDWVLDVVGSGQAQAEYKRLAIDLGIADKVKFLGFRPKPEVADIMRQANLFIVPSLFETFSVVTIEAMASGLPVVVTRCGGPEEYVSEKVGRVVPAADAEALADTLLSMFDSLDDFSPDSISCYASERFSLKRVGQTLHDIYSSVVQSAACKARHLK